MVDNASAGRQISDLFVGLDETTLDYVQSALLDEGSGKLDRASIKEILQSFVQESLQLDDASVDDLCSKVCKVLQIKEPTNTRKTSEATNNNKNNKQLVQPIKIAETSKAPTATLTSLTTRISNDDEDENTANNSNHTSADVGRPLTLALSQEHEDEPSSDEEEMALGICLSRGRFPVGESKEVHITGLCMTVHSTDLLENTTLKLLPQHRYGLVGKNGVGKSTLLKRMSKGLIKGFPEHLRTWYVRQEVVGNSNNALQYVLSSDKERERLLKREKELTSPDNNADPEKTSQELADIYSRLDQIQADQAEAKAKEILSGLNFTKRMQEVPTIQLSGGWRMRVALACALFLEPDLLLLDEPTNHLDLETVIWLQDYLKSYEGTIVVVSHDREFLNSVATDTIHFHKKQLQYYPNCNFDSFEKVRNDKLLKKQHQQAVLDAKREQMVKSVQKMEQSALGNKMDHKRLQQVSQKKKKINRIGLEKTEDGKKWVSQTMCYGYRPGSINENAGGWKNGKRSAAPVTEAADPSLKFGFPSAEPLGVLGPALQLHEVSFVYSQQSSFSLSNINMPIEQTARIGIVGGNGSGKSTLLQLLLGQLVPTSGERRAHRNLKIGYFAQHHVDQLDPLISPLEHLIKTFPTANLKEQEARAHLGSFGLQGRLALQPISTLSGGQKSRVVFATITFQHPHLLLLDEPTNHLDFDTIKALKDAVDKFDGAVIVVSHDQFLISSVCKELWRVAKGTVAPFDGTFEDYRTALLEGGV